MGDRRVEKITAVSWLCRKVYFVIYLYSALTNKYDTPFIWEIVVVLIAWYIYRVPHHAEQGGCL